MLLASQNRDAERGLRMDMQATHPAIVAPKAAATELGFLAHRSLRNGGAGRVAAVFERSFYAMLDGQWICVGADIGSGPLHVLCKSRLPVRPRSGDAVTVVGPTLSIGSKPFLRWDPAAVWTPEAPPRWTMDSLREGLRTVDQIWHGHLVDDDGLAAIGCAASSNPSPFVLAAMPGVNAIKHIVTGRSEPGDVSGLAGLIGLGPGLTPSGDDLIGGALIALAALGRSDLRDALWKACCPFLDRTNGISRAHLQTAALGYGAAALHDALHATMGGPVERIHPALAAVAAIGHTSGRDAFAGALMILRMVRDHSDPEERSGSCGIF